MAKGEPQDQGWVGTSSLGSRLDLWWSKLLPEQRAAALVDSFHTLPEWVAQGLLRAGVPLTIDPGFTAGSVAGSYMIPAEFHEFMAGKRAERSARKRFWQRVKS